MRRLIVSEFITLDGAIEDPGGSEGSEHGGWAFRFQRGPEGDRFKMDELVNAGALLLGRRTYEGFAAAWPERADADGFAAKMNAMPKYLVSSTAESPTWHNTTVIRSDVAAEVARLKAEPEGGDILVAGSPRLVQLLVNEGLVDEIDLMVYPLVLGGGRRLFGEGGVRALRLLEARPVGPDGVVILRYQPADASR